MEGGRKYDAPEPKEETRNKGIGIAVLAGLVVILLLLVATGTVQVFDM